MHLLLLVIGLMAIVGLSALAIANLKRCHPPRRKPRIFKEAAAVLFVAGVLSFPLHAADPAAAIALEPYGVLSWTGINGEAELGAGANLTFAVTRNLSLVGFGEANDTDNEFIERFGGGLRYTAYLGRKVSLYGGVGGGYDTADPHFFVRLPVGVNFHVLQTARADLALGASYAFDIDGNGKHGTATGRLFFGPTFKWKF